MVIDEYAFTTQASVNAIYHGLKCHDIRYSVSNREAKKWSTLYSKDTTDISHLFLYPFLDICAHHSPHYCDVVMGTVASQITSLMIVYSTVCSDADQSKNQSSASLAFVRGIHRGPVNSPHKWPVTRKMFPFDDVIMIPTEPPGSLPKSKYESHCVRWNLPTQELLGKLLYLSQFQVHTSPHIVCIKLMLPNSC